MPTKILDFGIARLTDGHPQSTLESDLEHLLGTLAYMSPEQELDAHPVCQVPQSGGDCLRAERMFASEAGEVRVGRGERIRYWWRQTPAPALANAETGKASRGATDAGSKGKERAHNGHFSEENH